MSEDEIREECYIVSEVARPAIGFTRSEIIDRRKAQIDARIDVLRKWYDESKEKLENIFVRIDELMLEKDRLALDWPHESEGQNETTK